MKTRWGKWMVEEWQEPARTRGSYRGLGWTVVEMNELFKGCKGSQELRQKRRASIVF